MIANDPAERWEQLESYLSGKAPAELKNAIDQQMKKDKHLADELESVRRASHLLNQAFIEQKMRQTLQQLRAEQLPHPTLPTRPPGGFRWVAYAAAICLLLLGYLTFAPIALPQAGYDVMALRNIDTTQLSPVQRAAFDHFFEGQARMVEGNYVQAAHHFENVLTTDDLRPYFREAAEWHLAVSYLKSRQLGKATQLYRRLQQCESCVYEVGWLNRRKMEWQLFITNWLP